MGNARPFAIGGDEMSCAGLFAGKPAPTRLSASLTTDAVPVGPVHPRIGRPRKTLTLQPRQALANLLDHLVHAPGTLGIDAGALHQLLCTQRLTAGLLGLDHFQGGI